MSGRRPPPELWRPNEEWCEQTQLTAFTRWVQHNRGVQAADYDSLWRWSVSDLDGFWSAIWDYFDVQADTPYEQVLAEEVMPGARWFTGAELNYTRHIFRGREDSEVAIRHASELRKVSEWTWGELRHRTAAMAASLKRMGVGPGDRVVAYLPNIPEAAAAFYACASIGSQCSGSFLPPSRTLIVAPTPASCACATVSGSWMKPKQASFSFASIIARSR
jgi:acetoacetyl-CoA synthetase